MRVVFENDTWWRECLGITPDKKWYAGHISQARPLPSWLHWLPSFQFCFNDKVAHAVAGFTLTLLLSTRLPLQTSVAVAWVVMAGYEFLPLLSGRTAYVSVKDLIANTVGVLFAPLVLR